MKRFAFLCAVALSLAAGSVPAAAQTPLFSTQRLTIGAGIERAWQFESLDNYDQFGTQWYVKVPFAYTLPLRVVNASLTGRAEKSLTSDDIGARLGVQIVLYRGGQWMPGGE